MRRDEMIRRNRRKIIRDNLISGTMLLVVSAIMIFFICNCASIPVKTGDGLGTTEAEYDEIMKKYEGCVATARPVMTEFGPCAEFCVYSKNPKPGDIPQMIEYQLLETQETINVREWDGEKFVITWYNQKFLAIYREMQKSKGETVNL